MKLTLRTIDFEKKSEEEAKEAEAEAEAEAAGADGGEKKEFPPNTIPDWVSDEVVPFFSRLPSKTAVSEGGKRFRGSPPWNVWKGFSSVGEEGGLQYGGVFGLGMMFRFGTQGLAAGRSLMVERRGADQATSSR